MVAEKSNFMDIECYFVGIHLSGVVEREGERKRLRFKLELDLHWHEILSINLEPLMMSVMIPGAFLMRGAQCLFR